MKHFTLLAMIILSCAYTFAQQKLSVQKSKEEILNEEYCGPLFNTSNAVYFDMLEDNAAISVGAYWNILDWLQGRVAGLQVLKMRNGVTVPFIRQQPASVFVDEIRVDYEVMNNIPTVDIAMIKVIRGPFPGSPGSPGGAILVYTKMEEEER